MREASLLETSYLTDLLGVNLAVESEALLGSLADAGLSLALSDRLLASLVGPGGGWRLRRGLSDIVRTRWWNSRFRLLRLFLEFY